MAPGRPQREFQGETDNLPECSNPRCTGPPCDPTCMDRHLCCAGHTQDTRGRVPWSGQVGPVAPSPGGCSVNPLHPTDSPFTSIASPTWKLMTSLWLPVTHLRVEPRDTTAAESRFLIHTAQRRHGQPDLKGSLSKGPGGQVFGNHQQEKFLTDPSKCGPNT